MKGQDYKDTGVYVNDQVGAYGAELSTTVDRRRAGGPTWHSNPEQS
jgi:hypothetical protein